MNEASSMTPIISDRRRPLPSSPISRTLTCGLLLLATGLNACDEGSIPTVSITATAERAEGSNEILTTIELRDEDGNPVDHEFQLSLAIGTSVVLHAEPEQQEPGRYSGSFSTPIGGAATLVVSTENDEYIETLDIAVPTGEAETFELVVGPPQLPGRPLEVAVVALDAAGNPVAGPALELDVQAELPFERHDTACGEPVLSFSSDAVGTFPIMVHDHVSGREVEAELRFEPAIIQDITPGPLALEPGQPAMIEVPVQVHVPDDWETSRLDITMTMDPGFATIAEFQDVIVDESSCAFVDELQLNETENGGMQLTFGIVRPFPFREGDGGGCLPTQYPRAKVAYRVGTGFSETSVQGKVSVDDVQGDTEHPDTGDNSAPLQIPLGPTYMCVPKTMYEGCIDYIRVRPTQRDGNGNFVPPPSADAIQQAHDAMNQALDDACVRLEAHIADFTLDIDETNRKMTAGRTPSTIEAVNAALAGTGYRHPGCMLVVLHDDVSPKGITFTEDPPNMPSPNSGTMLDTAALGNGRSLAHELGHQLLSHDPSANHHERDKDNLMTPTDRSGNSGATGVDIDEEQGQHMADSPWLTPRDVTYYLQTADY